MASIETMPLELKQLMLRGFNVDSLRSAVQASPELRRAFFAYEGRICHAILKNEFGEAILPIAIALYHAEMAASASHFQPTEDDEYTTKVISFCSYYLAGKVYGKVDPDSLTLQMTIHIGQFNKVAKNVTNFVEAEMCRTNRKYALDSWDRTILPKGPPSQLNANERQRLLRTIYVYELASKVVPHRVLRSDGSESMEAWRCFWSSFAPWEMNGIEALELSIGRIMHRKGRKTFIF